MSWGWAFPGAVENEDDIGPRLRGKLVINAALNPLTSLLRVKNGVLLESAFTLGLLGDLARKAVAEAFAHGVILPSRTQSELPKKWREGHPKTCPRCYGMSCVAQGPKWMPLTVPFSA